MSHAKLVENITKVYNESRSSSDNDRGHCDRGIRKGNQ